MKKRISALLLLFALSVTSLFACSSSTEPPTYSTSTNVNTPKAKSTVTPVTLNEVAHSIFYAPMYVAIEEGFFEEEGIDLTLVTGFGADKTMTAVISGSADIGFMGSEASIYTYNEGANDYVINFAQLTQRAGNFLVAREEMPDFQWEDLKNKKVLGGRKGGMPEMVFEYILKQNGLDPAKDLTIDQSIDFGSTSAAFAEGNGDFTVEFEPGATNLEKEGKGYVVASLGTDSGYVPYTAFSAKKSYIDKNPDIIQGFTTALQKGMDYVQNHTPHEIAKVIEPQFKETDLNTIETIVNRYYEQDTWKDNLIFEKKSFELLQDILETQENGVSAQDYFGKAPQPIADELLKQLPNDAKQMVKISLLAVLTYFAVVFSGSYFVSLFQPGTPQLIDIGEYVICSICAGISVFVILWLMGKNYGQKNNWKMLFTIDGIFVINCLLFVFVRTPWVIPLSRWMATVLAMILAVSVYLLGREKN